MQYKNTVFSPNSDKMSAKELRLNGCKDPCISSRWKLMIRKQIDQNELIGIDQSMIN